MNQVESRLSAQATIRFSRMGFIAGLLTIGTFVFLGPHSSAQEQPAQIQPSFVTKTDKPSLSVAPANIWRLGKEQTVDLIVSFDSDIAAIKACLDLPRDQLEKAQTIFADWAATEDALADLSLKHINESGDFILTWHSGIRRPLLRKEVDDRLRKLNAISSLRHAEPYYKAHPSIPNP